MHDSADEVRWLQLNSNYLPSIGTSFMLPPSPIPSQHVCTVPMVLQLLIQVLPWGIIGDQKLM